MTTHPAHRPLQTLVLALAALTLTACQPSPSQDRFVPRPATVGSGWFFDDFRYTGPRDPHLTEGGWQTRNDTGAPGMEGAAWKTDNVSFVENPFLAGDQLANLKSITDGTAKGTSQAELFQPRKFYEGTYATRMRFTDAPTRGPDGDPVVETFFTITPLDYDLAENYGEIDFEYLPNRGWGVEQPTLFLTTWETFQPTPWKAVNQQKAKEGTLTGWHTLVVNVMGAKVRYWLDGQPLATHGNEVYPETPMSFNFNQWFIDEPTTRTKAQLGLPSTWDQQVDWVYYAGNQDLTTAEVEAQVADLRQQGIAHLDTVPAWKAPDAEATPKKTLGPRPFSLEVPKVSGIRIDGDLSDWPFPAQQVLDQPAQVVYQAPGQKWGGPSDLSASLRTGWSVEGLWIAAEVTDDKVVQPGKGPTLWQGDYLEVQLDTALDRDWDSADMNEDDFQLGFSPGDFGKVGPELQVWAGLVSPEAQAKVVWKAKRTAKGYNLEAFLPAEVFGFTMAPGKTLGMNLNPSDGDDPKVPQKQMLSTSPVRKNNDPTTFGQITFRD